MPASKTTRLAQLRAHATGESHQAAHLAITSLASAAAPIIPEPTPQQEQLEGALFYKLAGLRWGPDAATGSGGFGIKRVIPAPNQLVIEVERGSDLREFVQNVMPTQQQIPGEPDPDIHGIPGLRTRPHGLGMSLYRPGLEGEVVVAGVSPDQWEAVHVAGFDGPHDRVHCAAAVNPTGWTKAERAHDPWRRERFGDQALQREANDHVLRSAMLRRIGLLNRLGPSTADSWSYLGSRGVVIEIRRLGYLLSSYDDFLADMTSPRLSPQLTVASLGSPWDAFDRTVRFTTPRSESFLQIRVGS